uniref:Uncharacterized protein n=1 Tax=Arundo donax TaxID=35708 RepID=A0A0A9FK84_ARUDO
MLSAATTLLGFSVLVRLNFFAIFIGWLPYMMMLFQRAMDSFQVRLFCHSYSDRLPSKSFSRQ